LATAFLTSSVSYVVRSSNKNNYLAINTSLATNFHTANFSHCESESALEWISGFIPGSFVQFPSPRRFTVYKLHSAVKS